MDLLYQTFSIGEIYVWEELLNNWVFMGSLVLLGLEFIRYIVKRRLTLDLLGDTVTNYVTLFMFLFIAVVIGAAYIAAFFVVYENYRIWDFPITVWSIALCILLADFAYYWEHRFTHRVGIGWATHEVHHSSPYFNISVAYRFGPLDGVLPLLFHLPLALIGFHPFLIFFSEIVVQLYQTVLHTEMVRKLPRPIEAIFNTPSHHRVHHGSNPQYLDRNYAGILIIWDRLFGTFAKEEEPVVYGLVKPVNSVNPLKVFFYGLVRLGKKVAQARGLGNKLGHLFGPPNWEPKPSRK